MQPIPFFAFFFPFCTIAHKVGVILFSNTFLVLFIFMHISNHLWPCAMVPVTVGHLHTSGQEQQMEIQVNDYSVVFISETNKMENNEQARDCG